MAETPTQTAQMNVDKIEDTSEEARKFFVSVLKGAATGGSSRIAKLALDSSNLTLNSLLTPEGCTALHLAAKTGKTEFLKWCKDNGGDFTVVDKEGNTLCIYAASTNHWDTFMYLATIGCDWRSTNNFAFDIVAYAASQEREDIIMFLLQLRSPQPQRSVTAHHTPKSSESAYAPVSLTSTTESPSFG